MKQSLLIDNCTRYDIGQDNILVYVKDNNLYFGDIFIVGKYYDVVAYRNIVNAYNNDLKQTQFFDIHNGELLNVDHNFIGICKNRKEGESDIVLGQYENSEGDFWIEFDTKHLKILKIYPGGFGYNGVYRILANYFFLSRDQYHIWTYNDQGLIKWQHSFTDLLQHGRAILHSPIIEHKGKLYFFLDGSPQNRTFCLDIETGEVLHQYPDLQGWLVREGDYLYTGFMGVTRLNTQTHEIVHWETQEMLEAAGLGPYLDYGKSVVQDGLLYFGQSMGVEQAIVGVLDFDNRALLWHHKFEPVGQIGSIRVHGNRLYVHTQDNTLHVFEREE